MGKKAHFEHNDLSSWPLWLCLGAAAIIFLLTVNLFRVFVIAPKSQELDTLRVSLVEQKKQYKRNKEAIARLGQTRKEVALLEQARDEAKTFLPTQVSMPSLIDDIYQVARRNGIVFNHFTPADDIETDYHTIKPIVLSADAGFISMAHFMEEVIALKRIMHIHSISFTSEHANHDDRSNARRSNAPLKMTAHLRTYIFRENKETE
ncbi:MAG: hypothetical protein CSA44_00495 [Gammaproteobacteria bacterium]|nr:MAG: hypothetical protein CSA44_00495 [Gammaproteobacteria bacterium]